MKNFSKFLQTPIDFLTEMWYNIGVVRGKGLRMTPKGRTS